MSGLGHELSLRRSKFSWASQRTRRWAIPIWKGVRSVTGPYGISEEDA